MTLQQLIYFKTIGHYGNFRRAAEELHVTQPCLSAAIAKLEQELEVYLFERKGRHVELTKLGKYYLQRVEGALSELEHASADLKRLASSTHGHVDVAFCGPLTRELVPKLIREFLSMEENQRITFNIVQMTTPQVIEQMKKDQFDVAFCTQVKNRHGLIFEPISVQKLTAIVPIDHPLAQQDSVKLRELEPYPFISYIVNSGVYNLILDWMDSVGIQLNMAYTAHDEESIAVLVGTGFGVSIVAHTKHIDRPDVKILPIEDPGAQFEVSLVHQPNQYVPPAVARFLKFAKSKLSKTGAYETFYQKIE